MGSALRTYGAKIIPALGDVALQIVAPRGVFKGVQAGFSGLLDICAHMKPGDASLSLLSVFAPSVDPVKKQIRLRLGASLRATDERVARTLSLAIERGVLAPLYRIAPAELPRPPWDRLNAACDIFRTEDCVQPLYSAEDNFRIPTVFYQGSVLVPNEENDYSFVDGILDKVDEWVVVHICVEPVDTTRDRTAITRYVAELHGLSRTWGDEPSFRAEVDYFGVGNPRIARTGGDIELPHKKDPVADAVLKNIQELRETLYRPHLQFHLRVLAETPEVAELLGAVVAQSAFQDGAYALALTKRGEPVFDSLLAGVKEGRVSLVPSLGARLKEQEPILYADLDRVAHIATPQELAGAFRWPVGTKASPYCIRASTDPPDVDPEELIILGFDYQQNHGV